MKARIRSGCLARSVPVSTPLKYCQLDGAKKEVFDTDSAAKCQLKGLFVQYTQVIPAGFNYYSDEPIRNFSTGSLSVERGILLMESTKKMSREEFGRNFEQLNASWGYEGAALDEMGKELLYKCLNGEISMEEFRKAIFKSH